MMRFGLQFSAIALCLLSTVTWGFGQEEQKSAAEPAAAPAAAEPATPAAAAQPAAAQPAAAQPAVAQPAAVASGTLTIKPEPFKIEVELSGVFEADQTWPVVLRPNTWTDFTVLESVPHGKRVQKGETLVRLDMKGIDEQLQDAEQGLRLNKLALQLATTELETTKATLSMDLETTARAKKIADDDLNYFLKINRSFLEESAQFSLKSSVQSLEYAEEELKQLEKMYNADDLTEETEEIVLKRARNEVEQGKFYLKSTELRTKKMLGEDIPRQEQTLTETAQRASVALDKTRATLPVQFEKQQIELQKLTVDTKRTEDKLQELIADRKAMAVESPADGYVYYGRCTRGKWPGVDTVTSQLQEGGKLVPNNAFLTVVSPRPLHVRADVAEKDLYRLERGLQGNAVPAGYPEMKLPLTVEHVSPFPIGMGSFDGYFRVTLDDKAKPVVPGMACKLTLLAYEKKDAIAIPATAVFENPADGEHNLVYVKSADGKPQERKVVVGQKAEQKWEIVEGLSPGEEIMLTKPDAP
ncbi:MAG: efflux RND transporter periplasmic adaptor subunit [Pirellulaceae bacterium]